MKQTIVRLILGLVLVFASGMPVLAGSPLTPPPACPPDTTCTPG